MFVPTAAHANISGSGAMVLTGTNVTVDAPGHSGLLRMTNTNTDPHHVLSNVLATVRLGLGCGSTGSVADLCPTPDPGVISVGDVASGEAGTGCAGRTFTISGPDAANVVSFQVQGNPVVLAPPGSPNGADRCGVVFPVHYLKAPTNDVDEQAGIQTRINGHVAATNPDTGLTVNTLPTQMITINPPAGGNGVADFNGDGSTDRSVYRDGAWLVHNQTNVFHGLEGDIPVPADYDGNGTTDRAIFRDGAWHTHNKPTVYFGLPGDIPVPGNYTGDGAVERAVYRGGAWHVEGMPTVYFGLPGDIPVPADYNGDGLVERAVYRGGAWHVEGMPTVYLGLPGDIPVPADYNGDDKAERAVFRGGTWFREGMLAASWGLPGDVPVPADYNNDDFADLAVYRNGAWHVVGFSTVFFGLAGDIPLPLPQAVYREFF